MNSMRRTWDLSRTGRGQGIRPHCEIRSRFLISFSAHVLTCKQRAETRNYAISIWIGSLNTNTISMVPSFEDCDASSRGETETRRSRSGRGPWKWAHWSCTLWLRTLRLGVLLGSQRRARQGPHRRCAGAEAQVASRPEAHDIRSLLFLIFISEIN